MLSSGAAVEDIRLRMKERAEEVAKQKILEASKAAEEAVDTFIERQYNTGCDGCDSCDCCEYAEESE